MERYRGSALLMGLLLVSLSVAGCLGGEPENRPPVAEAGGDIINPPLKVDEDHRFSAQDSSDPDGDDLTYYWDFDASDGSTDNEDRRGKTVYWSFDAPGRYNVTLTVSDGALTATDQIQVKVVKPPGVLRAKIETPDETQQTLHRGGQANVELDGSGSQNSEGGKENIVKYEWDFSFDPEEGFDDEEDYEDTGTEDSTSHKFDSGVYRVALRITNTTGDTDATVNKDYLTFQFNFNSSEQNTYTDSPQDYPLPVNSLGILYIRAELRYDAGDFDTRDLDLYLYNATGEEVEVNDTHDYDNDQQVNLIELWYYEASDSKWFDEAEELGEWKVRVDEGYSSADADYDLFLDVAYF